jgi:NADH-quinone oxidoreductase subunit L
VREVGMAMAGPMLILAGLSLIGGLYGTPWNDAIGALLEPVTGAPVGLQVGSLTFYISMALGLICAGLGIYLAWVFYGARQHLFKPSSGFAHRLLSNGYYVDTFYDRVIVRPIIWFGQATSMAVESVSLDGGSRGVAWLTARLSGGLRRLQTGYVRNYALGIVLGAAVILLYFVVRF